MQNTLGTILRLTTFGESHGPVVGGVVDGCPAGIRISEKEIAHQLKRRKTGLHAFASSRKEADTVEFLSGVRQQLTLGSPIAFIVRNKGQKPEDYNALNNVFRPSHADYAWHQKYGLSSGSGGGRSSARVLLPCVVAGCIANDILKPFGISVMAWVSAIGGIALPDDFEQIDPKSIESGALRCPDEKTSAKMLKLLEALQKKGDSTGGIVSCRISGVPASWGEPVFGKLHASLAHAMMGINSVKGFELGSGFAAAAMRGSVYNDELAILKGKVITRTNHDGGINGGISNGQDICFRLAFKPVPSIQTEQHTITRDKKPTTVKISGRHDTCVVPRSVPIVESLARFVLADHYLMQKTRKTL